VTAETGVGVFVNSVMRYFETAVQQAAECGIPHLALRRSPELSDYTGVIRISGQSEGVVLFSAPRSMLAVMLMRMRQTDLSEDQLRALVGEIVHTLSEDAQRKFRHWHTVSVQSAVHARDAPMPYPPDTRPIVIPIAWRSYQAQLVVCLAG
jgi:chemotaxis protein CheX